MMTQRPKKPAAKRSQAAGPMRATPPPSEKGYTQLSFALPKYYVDVLDKEAAFLGQRRSQLLEMLVLRKLGRFTLGWCQQQRGQHHLGFAWRSRLRGQHGLRRQGRRRRRRRAPS